MGMGMPPSRYIPGNIMGWVSPSPALPPNRYRIEDQSFNRIPARTYIFIGEMYKLFFMKCVTLWIQGRRGLAGMQTGGHMWGGCGQDGGIGCHPPSTHLPLHLRRPYYTHTVNGEVEACVNQVLHYARVGP